MDRIRSVRQAYYTGDLDRASSVLTKELAKEGRDSDVFKLDLAMVQLADGKPHESERLLREVRDRFDYLEQRDALESAVSLATDDQRLAYAGEDYEKVLIRAMLTISNLLGDGQDALAYSHQVGAKQNQIIEAATERDGSNPKSKYKRVAIGPYLYGTLREELQTGYDEAARSYAKVVSWAPDFRHGQADLDRARHGRHSRPGHGVLYVLAFVGRGPLKQEAEEQPTSAALLIADRILSATGKHTLPPTIAPVRVPQIVLPHNEVNCVHVDVDGEAVGTTSTVTNIGELAAQQHMAIYPKIVARAVVRRVVKKAVVVAGKDALNVSHPFANFAFDISGVAWEAAEAADTRCWGLLPDKIQVLRVELPVGEHDLQLTVGRDERRLGQAHQARVRVANGRNAYVLANFPSRTMTGSILVR